VADHRVLPKISAVSRAEPPRGQEQRVHPCGSDPGEFESALRATHYSSSGWVEDRGENPTTGTVSGGGISSAALPSDDSRENSRTPNSQVFICLNQWFWLHHGNSPRFLV